MMIEENQMKFLTLTAFYFGLLIAQTRVHAANGYACVDGSLYRLKGDNTYVGSSACATAKIGGFTH